MTTPPKDWNGCLLISRPVATKIVLDENRSLPENPSDFIVLNTGALLVNVGDESWVIGGRFSDHSDVKIYYDVLNEGSDNEIQKSFE